jgi:N-acetylmuramoyl-L-alanine amidase
MRRTLLLMLAAVMGMSCMAQRMGLVKDQDGYTNVRKGPGTKYEIVDRVPDGMFVNFGPGTNGWCKIYTTYTDGSEQELIGYMSANKIVVPPRVGPWKEVVQVKDEDGYTNIRKGAGTKYAIVGRVKDGSYILVNQDPTGEQHWLKVYTQEGKLRGYISRNKLMPLESPAF